MVSFVYGINERGFFMRGPITLWQETLNMLKEEINEDDFNSLFAELTEIYKAEGGYIYIPVARSFDKFRIEKFYVDKLNKLVAKLSDELIKFKFVTKADIEKELEEQSKEPLQTPELSYATRTLSPTFTFNSFEVGESNRFAFIAAMKTAESAESAEKMYNPLYIFGDVGLGKTHLMSAIGNYILDNKIDSKILYASSQKFAEDYFLATNKKKGSGDSIERIESFYSKYRDVDVLLIDDIQFLQSKKWSQEEFFKVFEHLIGLNKQIVITSDKPANELTDIMPRLRSRFNWGLSVDIKHPDKNLRVNILKSKLSTLIKDPSDVPLEVLDALADYFPNNIRDLEGALRGFVTYCICLNIPFTIENMLIALENTLPKEKDLKNVSSSSKLIEQTKNIVANYYKIAVSDLTSQSRKQKIAYARHVAMFLLRDKFNIQLKTIGEAFGNRDHATVSYGIDKIVFMQQNDPLVKNDIEILLKSIEK